VLKTKNDTLGEEKQTKHSSSYAKLATVATTLSREVGLFPANYADI